MRRLMVTAVAAAMVLTSCSSVTKTRDSVQMSYDDIMSELS